jgi:Domain of unknown function (DUF4845)
MKRYRSGQTGLTFLSVLVILGLIAFFTLLILKIGPIYLDNYKVKTVLASLESEPNLASESTRKVRSLLMRRFDINMVEHVKKKDIAIKKRDGVLTVEIDYEVIEPIIGNIDVLVYFDDRIEVGAN